jgi:CheY-like chemotaxis protein
MSTLYRVALLGFSAFERNALASYFRLAAHRVPRYEAAQVVSEADLMVADADHTPSVELVTAIERLDDTVFVGARPPSQARACLNRPIEPATVMRELDSLLAARGAPAPRAQDARRALGPTEPPHRSEPAPDEGEEMPPFDLKLRSEPAPIRSPALPAAPRRAPDTGPSRPGPLAAALTGLPSPLALPEFPPIVPPATAPIYPPLAARLEMPLPPAQAPTLTPTEDPEATPARLPPPSAVSPPPPPVPARPSASAPAPSSPTMAPAAAPSSMSGPSRVPSIAAPSAPVAEPVGAPSIAPSPTPSVEPPTLTPAAPPAVPAEVRVSAASSTTAATPGPAPAVASKAVRARAAPVSPASTTTPAAPTSPASPANPAAPRPSVPASRVAAPWRPAAAGAPSAPTMRALVVDDSEIAQRFLQKRLERFGLLIDCATNSEVALSLLTRHSYDFAFLDVELGESSRLDGLALCQTIKRHYATRVPPITVVLVTAHVGELDRVRGTLAGCDAFLGKPLDEAGLDRLLARHGLARRASTPSA